MAKYRPAPLAAPFKLPPNLQPDSKLLQMPSEIRVKIWRYLFKAGKPLKAEQELRIIWLTQKPRPRPARTVHPDMERIASMREETAKEYQDGVMLSSQALRVSQKLYVEGMSFLYPENTLSICCLPYGQFHIFDNAIETLSDLGDLRQSDLNILDFPCDQKATSPKRSKIRVKLDTLYPSLDQFGSVDVTIVGVQKACTLGYESVSITCFVLRHLLMGKNVSMFFRDRGKPILAKDVLALRSHVCSFRCKSIEFEGPITSEIAEIVQIVTSNDAVQDTVTAYHTLIKRLTTLLGQDPLRRSLVPLFKSHLQDHISDFDFQKFEDGVRDTIDAVKAESEKKLRAKVGELKE